MIARMSSFRNCVVADSSGHVSAVIPSVQLEFLASHKAHEDHVRNQLEGLRTSAASTYSQEEKMTERELENA